MAPRHWLALLGIFLACIGCIANGLFYHGAVRKQEGIVSHVGGEGRCKMI